LQDFGHFLLCRSATRGRTTSSSIESASMQSMEHGEVAESSSSFKAYAHALT